jgi:hypothetical protein
MIAGLLDAMRSRYSTGTRIVWQLIENRANRARICAATDSELAAEGRVSVDTVGRAVAILVRDGRIEVERNKRRRSIYRLLCSYPDGCRPRHEPEVAALVEPTGDESAAELSPQNTASSDELSPQNAETYFPPEKNPPGEGEDARARATPSHPIETAGQKNAHDDAAGRVPPGRRCPRAADEALWSGELDPAIDDAIREAGHDPAELVEEIGAWAARKGGATSSDWPGVIARWRLRCGGKGAPWRGGKTSGPRVSPRQQATDDFIARTEAKLAAAGLRPGDTIVGVAA